MYDPDPKRFRTLLALYQYYRFGLRVIGSASGTATALSVLAVIGALVACLGSLVGLSSVSHRAGSTSVRSVVDSSNGVKAEYSGPGSLRELVSVDTHRSHGNFQDVAVADSTLSASRKEVSPRSEHDRSHSTYLHSEKLVTPFTRLANESFVFPKRMFFHAV